MKSYRHYKYYRPHSSFGYVPPAQFAIRWAASAKAPAASQASRLNSPIDYPLPIPMLSYQLVFRSGECQFRERLDGMLKY